MGPNTLLKAGGKVIVIGAGFGGIAVALRMRARGYDVTLLDRLSAIGGRAQVLSVAAFAMMLARPLLPHLFYSMNYLAFSEKNEKIMSNFVLWILGTGFIFTLASNLIIARRLKIPTLK